MSCHLSEHQQVRFNTEPFRHNQNITIIPVHSQGKEMVPSVKSDQVFELWIHNEKISNKLVSSFPHPYHILAGQDPSDKTKQALNHKHLSTLPSPET